MQLPTGYSVKLRHNNTDATVL